MEFLRQYQQAITAYIEKEKFELEPSNLYEAVNYIMNIGGKRIRPLLLLMAYDLYDSNFSAALPAAFAVEMFHNFTLLHDDIMDEADIRRGKETVHIKYGVNNAILAGDVMAIYSYNYLSAYEDDSVVASLIRSFNKMAIEVCEGQQMDMDFEIRSDVKIEEYIRMIEYKTSVLIASCLEMGGIIGGADKKDQKHLYAFGKNIGIAFQIQDDIIDLYGKKERVGKKIGGDIIQGKRTYLYLKALELLGEDREDLILKYDDKKTDETEKIEFVKSIYDSLNVREYALQTQEAYRDLAYSHIEAISIPDDKKENLRIFGQYLLDRNV